MSCRVPSNLLDPLHMKRGKARLPPCTQPVARRGVRAGVSEGQFRTFVTGSVSPFVRVVFHPAFSGYSLLTHSHCWPYEIRREPIGIAGIVVVRVAVRVDIAEVGSVVVIRRTLPPIRSGTHGDGTPTDRFNRNTPTEV